MLHPWDRSSISNGGEFVSPRWKIPCSIPKHRYKVYFYRSTDLRPVHFYGSWSTGLRPVHFYRSCGAVVYRWEVLLTCVRRFFFTSQCSKIVLPSFFSHMHIYVFLKKNKNPTKVSIHPVSKSVAGMLLWRIGHRKVSLCPLTYMRGARSRAEFIRSERSRAPNGAREFSRAAANEARETSHAAAFAREL